MLDVLVQRSENTDLQTTGLGNDIGDRVRTAAQKHLRLLKKSDWEQIYLR